MPSSFFGLNIQSGTPQVRRYNGLSTSLVGSTFGSAQSTLVTSQPLNRVIQFGSQNTFLAIVNNQVYRSTDAGVTWTSVFTFTGGNSSGLNVIYSNGVPTVCFIYLIANTNVRGVRSTDGINWTADAAVSTPTTAGSSMSKDTIFRNALYVCNVNPGTGGDERIFSYSPGSAVSVIPSPLDSTYGSSSYAALCVFNDTLVYTSDGENATTGVRSLLTLDGGIFQLRVILASSTGVALQGKPGMLVDSNTGDLIVFTQGTATGTWRCWRVNSSYVATDIGTTVLPPGMTGTQTTNAEIFTFVDGEYSPGSNPNKYVVYANNNTSGTILTMYKWEGVSTMMTNVDMGGDIRDAFTVSNNCQGVGYWTSGENAIELINRTPSSGGIVLSFKLYSTGNSAIVNVRAWYGTQDEEYPTRAATLIGTTTSLTANGSTTYTVTWPSTTESPAVNPGNRFRLIMEVYV